jgi:hypothetical protein
MLADKMCTFFDLELFRKGNASCAQTVTNRPNVTIGHQ